MRKRWRFALVLGAALLAWNSKAQVLNDASGNYRLTPSGVAPRNFTIGNTLTTGAGSALNVRGDLMGTGNTTGEVFRTDAPTANSTYWRMFRGGTQYGLLYNLTGSNDFNAKVLPSAGNLWLRNSLDNGLRLNAGTLTATVGTYSPSLSSFVGIGPNTGIIGTQGAWARLHLDDGGAVITGAYRPWMKNGIYMSGNNDMMYVGQLFRAGADESDAVVAWGDNAFASAGPDHLRFIFMGSGVEGEEVTRITGDGLFGIGNFDAAGVQPTERVDVHNGRLRLRSLPGSVAANTMTKVLVVDDSPNPSGERGVIKWRDVSTLTGNDCKWTLQGVAGSNSSISTAYTGNTGCPQQNRGVGIGVQLPKNKLEVFHDGDPAAGFTSAAVTLSTHRSDANIGVGVHGTAVTNSSLVLNPNYVGTPNNPIGFPAIGSARTYTGVLGTAGAGAYSFGVEGLAAIAGTAGGVAKEMVGVSGTGKAANNSQRCIGVYGYAEGALNGNNWAGWFDGHTFCPLGVWSASDGQFKHAVQPLTGASEIIAALEPRTYEFNADAYGFMGFEPGTHAGLMADEVAEVLPYIVKDAVRPEQYNPEGELIAPEVAFKAINYQELIPILIASNKEQQERIARLEEMVAACCAAPVKSRATNEGDALEMMDITGDRRLMIQPNPFNERTTVSFTMEQPGRAQLIVNSSDGKDLTVLQDATLQTGEHRYEWNTSAIEPGMYYVTLLVEGRPVVKKAVKVAR